MTIIYSILEKKVKCAFAFSNQKIHSLGFFGARKDRYLLSCLLLPFLLLSFLCFTSQLLYLHSNPFSTAELEQSFFKKMQTLSLQLHANLLSSLVARVDLPWSLSFRVSQMLSLLTKPYSYFWVCNFLFLS